MAYNFTIKRSAYDYLRVSASSSEYRPDEAPFVAIHLNRQSFIKSVNVAGLSSASRSTLMESCTRAWNMKGIEILCRNIEITSEQMSLLRMVPHISKRHETTIAHADRLLRERI